MNQHLPGHHGVPRTTMSRTPRRPRQPLAALGGTVLPVNSSSLEPTSGKPQLGVFLGKIRPDTTSFLGGGRGGISGRSGRARHPLLLATSAFARTRRVFYRGPLNPACLLARKLVGKKVNLGLESQPVASRGCRLPSGGSGWALNLPLRLIGIC